MDETHPYTVCGHAFVCSFIQFLYINQLPNESFVKLVLQPERVITNPQVKSSEVSLSKNIKAVE